MDQTTQNHRIGAASQAVECDFVLSSWDYDQPFELDVFNESSDSTQEVDLWDLAFTGIYRLPDRFEERG